MATNQTNDKEQLTAGSPAGSRKGSFAGSDYADDCPGLKDYNVTVEKLEKLMENKGKENITTLEEEFTNINGLVKALKSSSVRGIMNIQADIDNRVTLFGKNFIPPKPPKTFLALIWEALEDTILRILIVAAVVSLILGMVIESVETGWIEGFAILVAVAVVSLVTALNDWQKEKQFQALQGKIDQEQTIDVIRGGVTKKIQNTELVVGDVAQLKYGDLIPADGILLQGSDVKVDESSLTGESDLVKKTPDRDIALYSGTHIMEGSAKYIITAVGKNSQTGKIMVMLGAGIKEEEKEHVPPTEDSGLLQEVDLNDSAPKEKKDDDEGDKSILQNKLTKMAVNIGWCGVVAAVVTTIVILIRFSVETYAVKGESWNNKHLISFLQAFITGLTILVVAIPEGLPLAVTISLAYSVKKMLIDNNLVRHLHACETMGNATAICSDKTGTLTTNRMTVVESYLQRVHNKDCPTPEKGVLKPDFVELLCQSISVNSNYGSRIEVCSFQMYYAFFSISSIFLLSQTTCTT